MSLRGIHQLLLLLVVLELTGHSHQFKMDDLPDFLKLWSKEDKSRPQEPSSTHYKSRHTRSTNIGDSSTLPYEVESHQLPMKPGTDEINDRYMPVLSTGLVAATVYGKSMYVNGLYAGVGANSHRARVPCILMTRVKQAVENERDSSRSFRFNVKEGYFMEKISAPYANIEHRTYLHQKYIRVLVTEIKMKKKNPTGGTIRFEYPNIDSSEDIRFENPKLYNHADWQVRGRTTSSEVGESGTDVYAYYTEQQNSLTSSSRDEETATMIMSVDTKDSAAKSDFDQARLVMLRNNGVEQLFEEHKEAWRKTWERGLIELHGELQISKITWFSQYYLLSSFPPLFANYPPDMNDIYYGVSRNSLGKGGVPEEYNGHIFWDNEMYIMPAVTLLHPDQAKAMLRFRAKFSNQAREYALATGGVGYRYPWETAYTGIDVTPDKCVACRENALHVTAAVGWAIRQYFSATRDRDILTNAEYNTCDMTREIARFWADKCVYNPNKGRYDLNDVMGPDDWHPKVNNSAYTNVMASLAIHWARYMACICNRNEKTEIPDEWVMKALYMDLPYDNVKRVHYQFEGFEKLPRTNQTNKQADTIMMTFPVGWNMSRDIMHNDLDLYEQLTDDRSPAMTWSFFVVGWKWVEERAKMNTQFAKSYQDYVIQPFKIWTEYNEGSASDQKGSSVNYLPAMGAYLQSLLYGFAGIRIRPEFLEFHKPSPPPDITMMSIKSFNYLGTEMDIEIHTDRVKITVTEVGDYELYLKRNESSLEDEKLTIGALVDIDKPELGFFILTSNPSSCEHPMDYIFMPWGYAPWLSSAVTLQWSAMLLILVVFVTISQMKIFRGTT